VKWPLDQHSIIFIDNVSKVYELFSFIIEEYDDVAKVVFFSIDFTRVCNTSYSKLYASTRPNERREDVHLELLKQIPCKFSPLAHKILEALIMEEELTKAVPALV